MSYSLTNFNHVSCLQWPDYRRRMACAVQHAATHSRAATPCAVNGQPPQLQVTPDSRSLLPIRVSQRIAGARAAESRRRAGEGDKGDPPLFLDPYAELLAGWQQQKALEIAAVQKEGDAAVRGAAMDVIATAHVDRLLLNAAAVSAVNRITQGDYRQVVLLGDAMDTRPLRLPLAPGTAIFMVAPEAAHAAAAAALASKDAVAIADAVSASVSERTTTNRGDSAAAEDNDAGGSAAAAAVVAAATGGDSEGQGVALGRDRRPIGPASGRFRSQLRGPRPPPGCLLRRVSLEFQAGADFSALPDALAAVGFRADRLSIWAVQGLEGLGLSYRDVVSLLAEAAHCAAYHSLVLGELPAMSYNQAANALAEVGLLGAPLAFGTPHSSYGRWQPEWGDGNGDGGESSSSSAEAAVWEVASEGGPRRADAPQRWLFAAQQTRLSVAQMDTYAAHRAAAEEADEDFFDNFS
ncbi:hypothetical protein Vretimale_10127 [Volvox reticuliferus]|uniref:Uncharacterized protein n=1 Tax=Volvox reticuliferus TaxID=1737510 RepID=A0A8J4FGF4_9CHLO|nr:hypothetical protein Vretifemale_589 [Volvox reticuliferus]GIM05690.1 hypothetical protein Vretimale_10127 [Volvox reticuliferus]